MLRRLLLVGLGFAAYACLGGCVVHAHRGPHVHHRTTPPPKRVYHVTPKRPDHVIDVKVHHHHPDQAGPRHHPHHDDVPAGHAAPVSKGKGKSKGKSKDKSRDDH